MSLSVHGFEPIYLNSFPGDSVKRLNNFYDKSGTVSNALKVLPSCVYMSENMVLFKIDAATSDVKLNTLKLFI